MGVFYLDSSAVVKLYISETGSVWVRSLVDTLGPDGRWANKLVLANICVVEVAAAIAKRKRMGAISPPEQSTLVANFLADCVERFVKLGVDDNVIKLATELTQRHPLRSYDAIHLATALILNHALIEKSALSLTFVSSDKVLCQAASEEGLITENPDER
ncbi:MAG TPA: PIN domain-containing protein [Desulfobacterales bacterium]|nr:PIN domain-containing protein [Desulfobacterales bacterium]